jgi:polysaccharide biosynthesis protein PslH
MRLLQICNKLPFPSNDGGSIAMNNVTMGLVDAGVEVTVFALNTPKTAESFKNIPSSYKEKTGLVAPFIDTNVKALGALSNLFSNRSYNLERFDSEEVKKELTALLQRKQFDVVQLESIFVSPYIPVIRKHSMARIILRAHNVEHKLWSRLSDSSTNPLKKWYLGVMAGRLKKEELDALSTVDAIATITDLDAETLNLLGVSKPIKTIPFGLPVNSMKAQTICTKSLFHIGAMNWMPNLEGVKWFLEKIYPLLNKDQFKLYLAGKEMPEEIISKASESLIVQSTVPDGLQYMADKSIMVVPLLSGGGMRVKIIEGMAMGKAIISTTIGAEGIHYEHGKNILIADTPEDFAKAIDRCLNETDLCKTLGANARKLAEEYYDNTRITKKLIDFYNTILN